MRSRSCGDGRAAGPSRRDLRVDAILWKGVGETSEMLKRQVPLLASKLATLDNVCDMEESL